MSVSIVQPIVTGTKSGQREVPLAIVNRYSRLNGEAEREKGVFNSLKGFEADSIAG